jgi:uncharacterized protein (DUF302 family)
MENGFGDGLETVESLHTVDETVARVRAILAAKGVREFALVDHSGEAERAGLVMPATKVLLFGNPMAGTPLMLAAPGLAIDLPLKLLVREDGDGRVLVSWTAPEFLLLRYGLPEGAAAVLGAAGAIARAAAADG